MKGYPMMFTRPCRLGVVVLALAALSACGRKQTAVTGGVPAYAVVTLAPTPTELNQTYPATIRGRQDVDIRPNVSGFITRLYVDEGATVRKGEPLFQIDPVQYEEAVNVARAAVRVAEANEATERLTTQNKHRLADREIISEYERQMADNTLASRQAALAQAEAQLVNAEKNLSYTRVESPSNGVVGTIPFRVGSLVSPSSAVPLTTVSDISEMYVYFSVNEKELLNLTREGTKEALRKMPAVRLQIADGTVYPLEGHLDIISGVIDPSTGAASVRASFPNPDRVLRSGGSGVVMLPIRNDSSIVIPQKATYELQDRRFVYTLTDSSTVHATEISTLPQNDGQHFVVTSGLRFGDRIVVEGVGTSLRDGMKIEPITPAESQARLEGAARQNASQGR